MAFGTSIQPLKCKRSRTRRIGIAGLALTLFLYVEVASPQGSPTRPSQSSPQTPSAFQEAESLLAQGLLDQAKEKIQEQLRLNPKSVEGYNLLGIVCTNQ